MAKTKGEQFAGVTVAIITPFKNGEVDYAALKKLVDWHAEQGTDCIAPVGTTGESPTLDHDEHDKVINTVVQQAAGRLKVMAGTGSNSTKEAVRLTKHAKKQALMALSLSAPITINQPKKGIIAITKPLLRKLACLLLFIIFQAERVLIFFLKQLSGLQNYLKLLQ